MEVFDLIAAGLIVGLVYGKLFGIFDLIRWLEIFKIKDKR